MLESLSKIIQKVGVRNVDACMRWALGDDYNILSLGDGVMDTWNSRHKDIFEIHEADEVVDIMQSIGKAYLKHLEERS